MRTSSPRHRKKDLPFLSVRPGVDKAEKQQLKPQTTPPFTSIDELIKTFLSAHFYLSRTKMDKFIPAAKQSQLTVHLAAAVEEVFDRMTWSSSADKS